jgi:hypothetical protein
MMKFLGILLVAAGCGHHDANKTDAAVDGTPVSPDAPACEVAACDANATCTVTGNVGTCACNAGYDGDGHTCTAVAVTLTGLRWEIPCGGDASATVCTCTDPSPVVATLAGVSGTTYNVQLRFRGVIEQKTYTGGTADATDPSFYVGGADNGDTYNVYKLEVTAPAQTYFLNNGTSGIEHSWALDYTKTIQMTAGATITLTAAAKDASQIKNLDATNTPIVIPGIAPAPAAYAGQFIQMDVVSVTH